jgi:MFS family permease
MGAVIGGFAGVASTAPAMIALIFIWVFSSSVAGTIGFIAVQELMPNEMRGLATSVIGFCNTVVGLGAGPLLVAWCADRVFQDQSRLGSSLSLIAVPAAFTCCLLMRACARRVHALQNAAAASTVLASR